MNSFQTHKKSDAIKWTVVTVIILCIIAAIVLGVFSSWYTNWDVRTWFSDKDKTEQTDTDKDKKDDLLIGEAVGSGVALQSEIISPANYNKHGVSSRALSALNITATVMPENADNKLVDWSLSFFNESSAWASGKNITDYVKITPKADGSNIVNVECRQAFGEQIILKCTSRDNADVSASLPLDYKIRAVGISLTLIKNGQEYEMSNVPSKDIIPANEQVEFIPTIILGVGTVDYNSSPSYLVEIRFTDAFDAYMGNHACDKYDSVHFDEGYGTGYNSLFNLENEFGEFTLTVSERSLIDMNLTYPNNMDGEAFHGVEEDINCFLDGLKQYKGAAGVFEITARSWSDNISSSFEVGFDASGLIVHVDNMTVNNSSGVIF